MSRFARTLFATALLLGAGGASGQQQFVNILTGGTSGVYYPLGVALSQVYGKAIPNAKVSVQATKASAENLNLLQAGRGEIAFTLYDTYGFPLDLTQDALRPRGIAVDTDVFNAAMERQREKARASWAGSGEAATETVWFGLREKVGATEFLGYETESAEGVVAAIVRDGKLIGRASGRMVRPAR